MVFHANGVNEKIVHSQEEFDRAKSEGWCETPQPPPPPPPDPLTPEEQAAVTQSELEGLGEQVDAQAQTITVLEDRANSVTDALIGISKTIGEQQDFIAKLEQRVDGQVGTASGTWQRLKVVEEAVKDHAALLADVKASMDQAAPALATILQRLEALESRKKGQ
jgi:archaellum component FlaC